MKAKPLFVLALGLGLSVAGLPAQAQNTPRQLGGAPVVVPPVAPAPVPPPRQLDPRPAPATAPTSTALPGAAPAVSTTPAPAATPDSAARTAAGVAPARPQPAQPAQSAQPAPYTGPPTGPGRLVGGTGAASPRFRVGLKSGTVYEVQEVEVKSPLFGRNFLLLDGQRRVDLGEVGFYENETGHYVRTALPGSGREATLRRERVGRISLYATYNTSYSPGGFGMPGMGMGGFGMGGMGMGGMGMGGMGMGGMGGYRTTKTEYFSKDNGPIQNLNARTLALATADNPGAQALLANARGYQTSARVAYVVGGGLLVAGLLQSFQRNGGGGPGLSPLLYAAVPVFIVPLIFQGKQGAAQRQAIALYNGQR